MRPARSALVSSTLADRALWDQALHHGRILSSRALELLFTTQHLSDGSDTGYAFGIIRDDLRGAPRLSHSGQTQGFSADYAHYTERDFSVIDQEYFQLGSEPHHQGLGLGFR